MRETSCCFTGHRSIDQNDYSAIKEKTKNIVISLIQKGVIEFYAGGALGFDTLAAETVLELKNDYPQIELILALPCPEQTKGWKEEDVKKYNYIKERAKKVVYTSNKFFHGCMHVRNRYLVDNSIFCVCYLIKDSGGTAYTVNYAKHNGLTVINTALC